MRGVIETRACGMMSRFRNQLSITMLRLMIYRGCGVTGSSMKLEIYNGMAQRNLPAIPSGYGISSKIFFEPEGYVLNGRIQYWGMDPSDWGKIEVHNNIVERFPVKCNAEFEGNVLKLSMPEWILAEIEKVAASKNVSVEYLFGRYIKWIALNPEQFKEWLWGGIMGVIRYQMEK